VKRWKREGGVFQLCESCKVKGGVVYDSNDAVEGAEGVKGGYGIIER